MENDSYACKAAGYINKAIDGLDRLTLETMFPRDLVNYNNGKLVEQERELPGWLKSISDGQKRLVNSLLCGSSDSTAAKTDTELPPLEINEKK